MKRRDTRRDSLEELFDRNEPENIEGIYYKRKMRIQDQLVFKKKIQSALVPVGYLAFTFHSLHEILDKHELALNIAETVYNYDGESFSMSTNESGLIQREKIKGSVLKRFFEDCYGKTKTVNLVKRSSLGCVMPIVIQKNTESIENDCNLLFFMSACYEKASNDLIKQNSILQRYLVTKGLGCSVIRAVLTITQKRDFFDESNFTKNEKTTKLQIYKICGKKRYDGDDLDPKVAGRGLNERKIREII